MARDSGGDAVVVAPVQRSPAVMLAKRAVQFGFLLLVLPRLLAYRVSRVLFGDRAFLHASESIARIPGMRGVYARQAFYRLTLAACGRDVYIGWLSTFSMPQATLGERAYVGRRCSIGYAHIGPQAMLADGVQVLSGGHEHVRARPASSDPAPGEVAEQLRDNAAGAAPVAVTVAMAGTVQRARQDQPQIYQRVSIGAGAWLGTNAVIMADVGAHAVVGAGAVVVHPVPADETVGGVPARALHRSAPPAP